MIVKAATSSRNSKTMLFLQYCYLRDRAVTLPPSTLLYARVKKSLTSRIYISR